MEDSNNNRVGSAGENNFNYNPPAITTDKADDPKYSKGGILTGDWSLADQSIINIILNDTDKYTVQEVKTKIKDFKGGI